MIIRGRLPQDNFTIIPNEWLRDRRMSQKARGVMAYILSHEMNYNLTTEQIIRDGKDGRDSVQAALRELEDLHYLVRHQDQNDDGTWAPTTFAVGKGLTYACEIHPWPQQCECVA